MGRDGPSGGLIIDHRSRKLLSHRHRPGSGPPESREVFGGELIAI